MSRSAIGSTRNPSFNPFALNSDGTSSNHVVSNLWSSANTNFSMGGWFKSSDYTRNRQPIMSNGSSANTKHGYAIILSGNATTDGSMMILNHNVAWIDMSFKVANNLWNHIMLTVSAGGAAKCYLNGVLKYSATPTIGIPDPDSAIGADGVAAFKGLLDDMRYYSVTLTQEQVLEVYKGGIPTVTPANWYKFDEGSGSTAIDSGSSPKNGTIAVMTYSTTVPFGNRGSAATRSVAATRSLA